MRSVLGLVTLYLALLRGVYTTKSIPPHSRKYRPAAHSWKSNARRHVLVLHETVLFSGWLCTRRSVGRPDSTDREATCLRSRKYLVWLRDRSMDLEAKNFLYESAT
ncbi:uncharacterized protein PGTG_09592 [Puccinia graminis f. sp. tritici CRL 75-36-700-3]|uniref:Secreted protein n=1 Tax=Puccinia graminis f. sp. tritici (strain CRL 75-36-700-3 / race SCCL) TaxID=418459 RepID=E3KHV4_PUCGT|nr:uncharacterized protein PGTG_09592 [Puccinia graminis f. sp. tritici CRL 75-36-700-3]EFP83879.1 hypothetical protein PGTG_09592 [Puccinia graminis f. sp. tritici CRL 75-36-700-3]